MLVRKPVLRRELHLAKRIWVLEYQIKKSREACLHDKGDDDMCRTCREAHFRKYGNYEPDWLCDKRA